MKILAQGLVALIAALALLGCSTLQPLAADSSRLAGTLKQGDKVQLVTTSGQTLRFAVEQVDEQGVHGSGQSVPFDDIQSISRNEMSLGRTTLLALGLVAAGALAAGGGGGSSY